ncbi:MAG TPA: hypothetical protein VK420_04135, partial [Longimicrobium sp.]|nr:hypothetical protein [Longimicrobium sp.]
MLRRLWPQDDAALHEALESLEDAGLVERKGSGEESRFTFRHTLIQETAHHSLLRKRRQQYHLQLARLLLEERKETAEAQPELVAHHFAEGGSVEQAVEFFERAGLRANQRSAHLDAVSHYSRALQLVQGLPESPARHRREVGLRIALGGPLMAVRGYAHPEVERVYRRARELCRFASEDAQLIPALMGLWQYYIVAGDLLASRELAEQLTALARAKGDETARVLAYRALSTTEHLQGEPAACLVHSLEGLALYQISKHRAVALKVGQDPGVAMAMYAGWSGWMMGRADDALRYAKEGTALGRQLDHPMSLSLALCYLALVHNYRGEYAEALAAADEGLALSRNHGLSLWIAGCITQRGWARTCLGSPEGLEEFADGIDAWTDTGAGIAVTFFSITLAELCLDAGRTADAASLLEDAAGLLGRNQEHFYEAELYRLEADLTLAADPTALDAAAGHLQRALEIAKRQGVLAFELRVRGDLLRLARQRGDDAEAKRALEETLGRFDQGHDTVDLRR